MELKAIIPTFILAAAAADSLHGDDPTLVHEIEEGAVRRRRIKKND